MLVIYDCKLQICWLEGLLLVYGIPVYRAFGIPSCRDFGKPELAAKVGDYIYDCKFQIANLGFLYNKVIFLLFEPHSGRKNVPLLRSYGLFSVANAYLK